MRPNDLGSSGYRSEFDLMRICRTCRALFERWHPSGRPQRCGCGSGRKEGPAWPGFDFNERAHLCECCAMTVLSSGSRWSVWFCDTCRKRVTGFNARHGYAVIPIGRHSLMAGVAVSGPELLLSEEPREGSDLLMGFLSATSGLIARMNHLHAWHEGVVAGNLRRVGLDGLESVAAGRIPFRGDSRQEPDQGARVRGPGDALLRKLTPAFAVSADMFEWL